MRKPKHIWMVRAGDKNKLDHRGEEKAAVAIGWAEMGDVSTLAEPDDFKAQCVGPYPDQSPRRAGNAGLDSQEAAARSHNFLWLRPPARFYFVSPILLQAACHKYSPYNISGYWTGYSLLSIIVRQVDV